MTSHYLQLEHITTYFPVPNEWGILIVWGMGTLLDVLLAEVLINKTFGKLQIQSFLTNLTSSRTDISLTHLFQYIIIFYN